MQTAIRTRAASMLEDGTRSAPLRLASRAWALVASRRLVRPVDTALRLVAVGGATLGGSGKTSLAIACARELRAAGARVALVGHGYRASPGRARRVTPTCALGEVGDDALLAARALADDDVPVLVAPTRAAALRLAGLHADVCVVDGLLQSSPRAALSLLAVAPETPWGSGACPPAGDLRAPPAALLSVADHVVPVAWGPPRLVTGGRALSPGEIGAGRFGVFTACGHPERVVSAARALGIAPVHLIRAPDHGPAPRILPEVDAWVAAPKCALHLEARGLPVAVLRAPLELSHAIRSALRAV